MSPQQRRLAAEDLDLLVCLGDYVYEATVPGVGDRPQPLSAAPVEHAGECTLYRSDPELLAMHEQHAFPPLWDDHEFRNNHSKDNWTLPELFSQEKKSAAWHAWFERVSVLRYSGDMTRTYRSLKLGRTVELLPSTTVSTKDDQPCGGGIVCTAAVQPASRGDAGRRQARLPGCGQTARQRWSQHQLPGPYCAAARRLR